MTSGRFCDWLQGYVELQGELPTQEQWEMIKEHLALVYNKVTSPKKKGILINKAEDVIEKIKKLSKEKPSELQIEETPKKYIKKVRCHTQKLCSSGEKLIC